MTRRVAHYELGECIGRGGMGEIYLARDETLERTVVLKAISPALLGEENVRRRFLREARATAALTHPFICTVHEVLEHEDQPFIVMEYIQGETLLARLSGGPLPSDEVCRIGLEVAEALSAAHALGIVHRDITATNIMITTSGHAKVMDFGIARIKPSLLSDPSRDGLTVSQGLTGAGVTLGTPAYMAPELLRSREADARSDLYSLGVVLYQMATGRLPFTATPMAVLLSEILGQVPRSPRALNPELPWGLERLILRLLDKEPEDRPPNAESVAEELRRLVARDRASTSKNMRSIAVLPFKDLAQDGENAHLGLGLADATITELAFMKSLLVRPTAAIMRYQDRRVDPLQAGRELSVDAVVDGSFQRAGSRVRVTVQLISTADGTPLWGNKVTTSLDDVFQMQDEVSREIAAALEIELTQVDESRRGRTARPIGEAYELYLKGRFQLLRETVDAVNAAIEFFEKARDIDPGFAQAYAGLSDAYARIAFTWEPEGDWYSRAEEMCQKALTLDPQLTEARYLHGRLLWSPHGGFDHAGALREFGAAIAARPSLNEAHHWMGILLFHLALFDESAHEFERALAINPEDLIAYIHLGFCRYLEGDYRSALDISESARQREPSAWVYYQMALAEIQLGFPARAEQVADVASRQFPGDVLFYPIRGLIAALRGDASRALQQVRLTVKNQKSFGHYHHAQYDVACIYARLGQKDEALTWLKQAATNGFPCYRFFEHDALLEPIRADERFRALMGELRAQSERYRASYEKLRDSWGR